MLHNRLKNLLYRIRQLRRCGINALRLSRDYLRLDSHHVDHEDRLDLDRGALAVRLWELALSEPCRRAPDSFTRANEITVRGCSRRLCALIQPAVGAL